MSERIAALRPEQRALLTERLKGNEPVQPTLTSIPKREGGEPLPLSFAQQRLWFLKQLDPDNFSYHVPVVMRLAGQLNIRALEESLNGIVRRHEILRTSFLSINGEPAQVISPFVRLPLPVVDLSDKPPGEREESARQLATQEARQPFDLSRSPLFRSVLIRLSDEEHILVLTMHHIICDGWSMGVLVRELGALYETNSTGSPSTLPELPIQYADFTIWQRERLQGELLEKQLSYWKLQLGDRIPPLELPADRPRSIMNSRRGARESVVLPRALSLELKKLSRGEGVTLFMISLAAFQALLYRYTNQQDIVVGTPVANRTRSELEDLIGFFVNTLVIRTNFSGDPTFRELLERVRETALGAYVHQDVPFEKLVEELQPERSLSHTPFFNITFALQNTPSSTIKLPGLMATIMKVDTGAAKFDLSLSIFDEAEGLRASVRYKTDLFDSATIARMLGHFQVLLEGVVADPAQHLSQLPLLTAVERQRQIVEWNNTTTDYPRHQCIHQLFEAQSELMTDSTALSFKDQRLNYGELNRRANQLAHYLRKQGIGPEVKVGVAVESLPEMVVALLGVLKAGGAYVPLDSRYPRERLRWMLKDAEVAILLTQEKLIDDLTGHEAEVVLLDRDREMIGRESAHNLTGEVQAENTACVIYTSGSTGMPKGISIPHRAVVRLLINTSFVKLTSSDRIAQVSNVSFDATLFEIWGALLNGAQLVGMTREQTLSPQALATHIREQEISVMFLTTALFNQVASALPSAFNSMRCLLFGGEVLNPEPVREVLRHGPPQRLLHVYGPTESTTFACWHKIEDVPESALKIPIGRPLSNTKIYLLDDHQQPTPVGVPGEIYIGGDGLARDYLNRPELTAEKFIPDPFIDEPGARLYRTGDMARYLPDGEIDFIERRDSQVKIRGYRIELGEIETQLCNHPAVKEAVVLAREVKDNDKRLTAYLVLQPPLEESTTEEMPGAVLRAYLKDRLPPYMLPSEFVRVLALPLTPNGKVDRQALTALKPERRSVEVSSEAPRGLLEHQLTQIWEEVLGVHPIGLQDNFFELGGHSLLAVNLLEKIERLCGRKLPLTTLFEEATIEHLLKSCLAQIDESSQPSLIAIQSGGSRRPFFFLHGDYYSGGFYCLNLARHLGPDQPFYVLPSYGGDGRMPPLTIEEMATQHLETLREFQPDGPYLLGGFCHGGLAAFEMSRQLQAQGQKVELLVLIHAPTKNARLRFFQKMIHCLGSLVSLTPEKELDSFIRLRYFVTGLGESQGLEKLNFVLKKARKAMTQAALLISDQVKKRPRVRLPEADSERESRAAYSRQSAELELRYHKATLGYVPQKYSGRVTLLWPEQESAALRNDPTKGWRKVAKEVTIYTVPGDHLTSITRHHQAVAEQLRICLQESQPQSSDD